VVMPVIATKQPQTFDAIARLVPERIRCALGRIDDVHAAASNETKNTHPARADIKKRLSLIFVDVMVIVATMITFTVVFDLSETFADAASGLNLLRQEIVLLLLLVIVAPIVYNMYSHVKGIAKGLTALVMDSPKETKASERRVYLMFANLGTVAMILLILVIVVPFLPQVLFGTVWTIAIGGAAVVIVYLSWNTVKQGYDRCCQLISSEGREEPEETHEH